MEARRALNNLDTCLFQAHVKYFWRNLALISSRNRDPKVLKASITPFGTHGPTQCPGPSTNKATKQLAASMQATVFLHFRVVTTRDWWFLMLNLLLVILTLRSHDGATDSKVSRYSLHIQSMLNSGSVTTTAYHPTVQTSPNPDEAHHPPFVT